ncbi:hypothetical protein O181_061602 [Austropuccinia psidii MF-1]|uniref:Uncharacterized protein n=1 Tax=Austropuccinia psidii MF-1 TaxID=1389203 RepID=A0A9Q3EL04_9BASI|nr:hypothetical protein [Austropuccinia psidii MF-1]
MDDKSTVSRWESPLGPFCPKFNEAKGGQWDIPSGPQTTFCHINYQGHKWPTEPLTPQCSSHGLWKSSEATAIIYSIFPSRVGDIFPQQGAQTCSNHLRIMYGIIYHYESFFLRN